MHLMRGRSLLLMLALSMMAPPAWAGGADPVQATPVQREQAQSRFLRGKQLFESRSFEAALTEFRASHDVVASPNTRLYIARSLQGLGRIVEAYVEYGRTDVEAREHAQEDGRYAKAGEAAAAERDVLKQRLGFVVVRIERPEETTKLLVANEEIRRGGWAEPIPVAPGATEVRLETPGRGPVVGSVTLDAGQTKELALDAASGPKTPDAAPPLPAPALTGPNIGVDGPPPSSLRPYAYVAGGVGAVGLATFAVFGLMAKSTHDDLEARCPSGACSADPASDVSSGKSQQTVANVGLVVGALGVATGVVLFVLEPKQTSSTSVGASLGFGRVNLEGRF